MITLDELGPRIYILGPSNSGKSTIGAAISRARQLDLVHLDQLYHLPQAGWVARPTNEFTALHDAAIAGSQWVIEGNFTTLLPPRVERATGFILLDVPASVSLYRYFRRSWFEPNRVGGLDLGGGRDSVSWDMIHYIAVDTRASRKKWRQTYDDISLPKVLLDTDSAVAEFYRVNALTLKPE